MRYGSRLRRLFGTGVAALSLLLCVMSILLWTISFLAPARHIFNRYNPRTHVYGQYHVGIEFGSLIVNMFWEQTSDPAEIAAAQLVGHVQWQHVRVEPSNRRIRHTFAQWLGFRFRQGTTWSSIYPNGTMPFWGVDFPFWLIAVVTAVWPARWFWLHRRRVQRRGSGQCEHCGYDLRETPHRCPECGMTPKETAAIPN